MALLYSAKHPYVCACDKNGLSCLCKTRMMFRKCLLAGFLMAFLYTNTNAQSLTVDSYANQLFFNIYKDQPDAAIRDFLKLYVPSLLDKKTTAAPAGARNQYSMEVHSFVFTQHPYFKTNFTNGKLEFECRRYDDARGIQVTDVRLWMGFDSQEDAETAFSKLIATFQPLSTKEKIKPDNGALKAQFSDTKATSGFSKVTIRLTPDNMDRSKFRMLFELGNEL